MNAIKTMALLLAILSVAPTRAQNIPDDLKLDNRTYVEGIESVSLLPIGHYIGAPIMKLGAETGLTLTFDDLHGTSRYYKYTFLHCTGDWQLSDLNPIEYIDGFEEDEIRDYNYSFNTIVHYVQYSVTFPNGNIKPAVSGNYVLFVYDGTPDNPVLTRRFMVLESDEVGIRGEVHAASDVNDLMTGQEVDFVVSPGMYSIRNPAMTLRATIMQNGRWDNAKYNMAYRSESGNEISFDYDDGRNVFDGGAEFRTFDLTTLVTNADHVIGITFKNRQNQAYLLQDEAMPYGAYESRGTLDGACYYHNQDLRNPYSEDYVNTHFTLNCGFPITGGDVYVFGQLTDWQIKETARLKYNSNYKFWEAVIPLKQGKYNYQYVYVPHDEPYIDATYIEGNHYQTGNLYTVLIYYREEGGTYDRLVGVGFFEME